MYSYSLCFCTRGGRGFFAGIIESAESAGNPDFQPIFQPKTAHPEKVTFKTKIFKNPNVSSLRN
jgi:hypothetical protein